MNKQFKVGDHVVIECCNIEGAFPCAGKTGVITTVWGTGSDGFNYRVRPDEWKSESMGVWCEVKCLVEDEFDFGIGARIAMERLYPDKSEPNLKYLSCKFVLTSNSGEKIPRFTEGKVYELKNGVVISDDGLRWPGAKPIMDENDLRVYFAMGNQKRVPYSGISAKVIIIKE